MSECYECKLVAMGKGRSAMCYDCLEERNVELKAELADTVTECLAAKSNEDIMHKQLADRTEEWSKYCGELKELLAEAYDTFRETYAELTELSAEYHGERLRADSLFDQLAELREATSEYVDTLSPHAFNKMARLLERKRETKPLQEKGE